MAVIEYPTPHTVEDADALLECLEGIKIQSPSDAVFDFVYETQALRFFLTTTDFDQHLEELRGITRDALDALLDAALTVNRDAEKMAATIRGWVAREEAQKILEAAERGRAAAYSAATLAAIAEEAPV